jgi:hypothetical protein
VDLDASDFQNFVDLFNVTSYLSLIEMLEGSDFFAGQYHGQCAHHSATHSADYVIQSGGVLFFWFYLIKILYSTVDAIINRLTKAFDQGFPGWALFSGDGNL